MSNHFAGRSCGIAAQDEFQSTPEGTTTRLPYMCKYWFQWNNCCWGDEKCPNVHGPIEELAWHTSNMPEAFNEDNKWEWLPPGLAGSCHHIKVLRRDLPGPGCAFFHFMCVERDDGTFLGCDVYSQIFMSWATQEGWVVKPSNDERFNTLLTDYDAQRLHVTRASFHVCQSLYQEMTTPHEEDHSPASSSGASSHQDGRSYSAVTVGKPSDNPTPSEAAAASSNKTSASKASKASVSSSGSASPVSAAALVTPSSPTATPADTGVVAVAAEKAEKARLEAAAAAAAEKVRQEAAAAEEKARQEAAAAEEARLEAAAEHARLEMEKARLEASNDGGSMRSSDSSSKNMRTRIAQMARDSGVDSDSSMPLIDVMLEINKAIRIQPEGGLADQAAYLPSRPPARNLVSERMRMNRSTVRGRQLGIPRNAERRTTTYLHDDLLACEGKERREGRI